MKLFTAAAAACFVLTLAACSETPQKPQAAAPVKVEKLAYTERTLANGLRVFAMPDAKTANVAVHVWYGVGSKDDPKGRSGFAHLFEHVMFKATRNMPPETMDRLTEDVGGFNNASTADDYTNYYEVVPAGHLERVLWAEAERMGSLVIDEATFRSERDVVKEEFRQRILAQPYGKLFGLYVAQANYSVHPYGRPGIGSIEELDAATIADVRAFHATFYRPDNAVLVVAGNFDPKKLDAWVDRYFAPLASPKRPIPRVTAVEPPRTAPRVLTVYEPNTPLPAVAVTYPGPDSQSKHLAAILVMDAILSKGESSRLYRSLVYEKQIAAEAFTFFDPSVDAGLYTLGLVLSEGKSVDDGVKALAAEIARMRDGAVTAAELEEAKIELLSDVVRQRETSFGRAYELANSVTLYRDPTRSDRLLSEIQAVTPETIKTAAKTLFDDKTSVTIRYLGEETKPANASADTIVTGPGVQTRDLSIPAAEVPVFTLAPEATRVKAPAAAAPVSAALPTPVERTLANGLRVVVASKRDLPLLSAELRVLSGSSADPAGRSGAASLAADVLTKGTKTRSAGEIATQAESLGATLGASAGADSSSLSLEVLSSRGDEALAIAADVARNPAYAAEEVERQRRQTLDGLTVSLRQPGTVARYAMSRVLFGASPYGGVTSPASVAAVTRDDIGGFHAARWRPDNAVLLLAGDVSADDGFRLAEKHFGGWAKPAAAMPAEPDPAAPALPRRIVFIDLPKSGQAAVAYGTRGVSRTDKEYFPLLVANAVLGVGYSSRLNQEIRIKRGLSYGAGASFPARLAPGPVVAAAQTRNDAAVQVAGLMESELTRLAAQPARGDELAARSASLIGSFGREVETVSGLSGELANLASFGIPLSAIQTYVADVAAVTPEGIAAAAARIYDPKAASVVVVGDGAVIYETLKKRHPTAERIPLDRLNLDRPSLQ